MTIGNRSLQGQPSLPYVDNRSYAGVDVFLDLTFLDYTGALAVPTSVTYQLDDITNQQSMINATTFSPGASTYTLNLPASAMVMTKTWQGSQLCQLLVTATLSGGKQIRTVAMIELIAIQTPNGN